MWEAFVWPLVHTWDYGSPPMVGGGGLNLVFGSLQKGTLASSLVRG